MESYINRTAVVFSKNNDIYIQKTGILTRIPEVISFYMDGDQIGVSYIMPTGRHRLENIKINMINQLNDLSKTLFIDKLAKTELYKFSAELNGTNLRLIAERAEIIDDTINVIKNYDLSDSQLFTISIYAYTSELPYYFKIPIYTNIYFKLDKSSNFLYYDFTLNSEICFANDLYLIIPYHNIDKSTTLISAIIKYNTNNLLSEKVVNFMLIGADISTDIAFCKFVDNNDEIDIQFIDAFHLNNLHGSYITNPNIRNDFYEYRNDIRIGQECYIIGSSNYDNNSISKGHISDNMFSGLYYKEPMPESILVSVSACQGYSGSPLLIYDNLAKYCRIAGMIISGIENDYYNNICIAISNKILLVVITNIFYRFAEFDLENRKDTNFMAKELKKGYNKAFLGLKTRNFNHIDIVNYPSLKEIFQSISLGGIWIDDFIKGYDTKENLYVCNILETNKKNIILVDNPFKKTRLWTIFHEELQSKIPILLKSIIYYNKHQKHNVKLDLGKYKSSTHFVENRDGIILDYCDKNTGKQKQITYFLDKGYTGQRPLSEFIYDYWKNEDNNFSPFVVEYAYFKQENNTWITSFEEIIVFINKYLEYSVVYPIVLFGYERISNLLKFADEINPINEEFIEEDITNEEPNIFEMNTQMKFSYA